MDIILSGEKLNIFLDVMNILRNGCPFLTIKDSKCRLFGNNKSNIFDTDLTSIFGRNDVDIAFSNVDQKYKLLDILQKNDSLTIHIDEENKKYIFHDGKSKVNVPFVFQDFINKTSSFVDDGEYDKRTNISGLDFITKGIIDKDDLSKINSFSRVLSSKQLNVSLGDSSVKFMIQMADSNTPITTDIKIITESVNNIINLETASTVIGYGQFKINPILFCNAPINFELYVTKNRRHMIIKMTFTFGEKEKLDFTLWNISSFFKQD